MASAWPAKNVRILRLFQARCLFCGWSSEIVAYPDRWMVEADKRAHVAEHRNAAPALTPSADVPACRDEDPAQPAVLAAAYPDPPDYPHPEDQGPLEYTEADRAYDRDAFARDYGLRDE